MTLLEEDGRLLIIALDHGLYSWPNPGLEDRRAGTGGRGREGE